VLDFYEKPQEDEILNGFEFNPSHFGINLGPDTFYLGSMGIYVFKREILISLLTEDPRDDFGFHLISTAVKRGKTFAYLYDGYWEDIGTIASYYEANMMLTHGKNGLNTYDESNPIYARATFLPGPKIESTHVKKSIICEGCIIEASEITNCIIGLRTHIRKGSIIRDTVVMGNHLYMPPLQEEKKEPAILGIGENCLIERAIIDEHVSIGNNVKLVNEKKLDRYEKDGIFIRDGIIIVTSGTSIPDGFIL
jgi:glucose-1-phosphate adenylyltransferase